MIKPTYIIKNGSKLVGYLWEDKLCSGVEILPGKLEGTLGSNLEPGT